MIADLPGIYSLSPYTLEEVVARNYLISEKPDAILNIMTVPIFERNLYLSTQLMELGIPVVMAVNMMDVIQEQGRCSPIISKLAKKLGCQVVEIPALRNEGVQEAAALAVKAARCRQKLCPCCILFDNRVEEVLSTIKRTTSERSLRNSKDFLLLSFWKRMIKFPGSFLFAIFPGNCKD